MRTGALLLLGILIFSPTPRWRQEGAKARLIHRFERGYGSTGMEENAAYLADAAGLKGVVALRVCSKASMPVALLTAAADPFVLTTALETAHGFTPPRVKYLRAENCEGPLTEIAATEFWAVPAGAALPPHVEAVDSGEVVVKRLGAGASSAEGAQDYWAATRELVAALRECPRAQGVVLGYYFRRPTDVMTRRLGEVRTLLARSGLRSDRYFVRVTPWPGDRSTSPPEPEPAYPTLSVVTITTGDRKK